MLSVIIPVYNTEKYIRACLDSVANQTYQHLEVIMVNDGSTDGSGRVCDEYAEKYANFYVFHQENQGVVAARILGVVKAKSKYVTFVDSDDWIEPEFYETLVARTEGADVITSGIIYEGGNRKKIATDAVAEGVYQKEQIENYIWSNMVYHKEEKKQGITAYLWGKIFRKELLWQVMSGIDKEITYCEDGAAVYSFLTRANKVAVTHYCGYHYRQREDSAVHTHTLKRFETVSLLQQCMRRELLQGKQNPVLERQINAYVATALSMAQQGIFGFSMKEAMYLFPYHVIPKGRRVILYGAGVVGTSFYECLRGEKFVKLVAWVDKNHTKYEQEFPVMSPEVIGVTEYDFVIIAIEEEVIAREIREDLIKRGVEEEKIVWEKPQRIR